MPVTLYVLKSSRKGKRYVGITNDLARRLREHRAGRTGAGQILGDFGLLYAEQFSDYAAARERERFLKSG
jgi:predicted GIY-YIG superfamily endonuclease